MGESTYKMVKGSPSMNLKSSQSSSEQNRYWRLNYPKGAGEANFSYGCKEKQMKSKPQHTT